MKRDRFGDIRSVAIEAKVQEFSEIIKVLYLDLDGTVRKGYDELGRFVNGPEDVEIFPEALAAMREYKHAGWKIAAVTNQGGIALGHLSIDAAVATCKRTYDLCDRLFDKIAMCRHHPAADDPLMASCWCRKPKIGMLINCAEGFAGHGGMCPPSAALMVGDREEDKQCAENAGVRFLWAKDWRAGMR